MAGNLNSDLSYFIITVRTDEDGIFCCISRCTDAEVVINEVVCLCVQTQYRDFLFTYCTGNGVKLFMKLYWIIWNISLLTHEIVSDLSFIRLKKSHFNLKVKKSQKEILVASIFPNKNENIFLISAHASKKWSTYTNEKKFNHFNKLIRGYVMWHYKVPLFFIQNLFRS